MGENASKWRKWRDIGHTVAECRTNERKEKQSRRRATKTHELFKFDIAAASTPQSSDTYSKTHGNHHNSNRTQLCNFLRIICSKSWIVFKTRALYQDHGHVSKRYCFSHMSMWLYFGYISRNGKLGNLLCASTQPQMSYQSLPISFRWCLSWLLGSVVHHW